MAGGLELTQPVVPEDRIDVLLRRLTSVGETQDLTPLLNMLERLCCAMEMQGGEPQVIIAPGVAPQVQVHPVMTPPVMPPAEVNVQPAITVQAGDNIVQPSDVKMVYPQGAEINVHRDDRGFIDRLSINYRY